jgi:glyoxalase family protein
VGSPLLSLHHVTATVDDAQADLDFFAGCLGLRLVKKTINFDNRGVYHFYYGDERGTPGTIWTTFPYKGKGVAERRKGAGQVTATSFSVPAASLTAWRQRLGEFGVMAEDLEPRFGEERIRFFDPSGLAIDLVGTGRDDRVPWAGSAVEPDTAIRGLDSVSLTVRDPAPSIGFLSEVLGFEVVDQEGGVTRLVVGDDRPGQRVDLLAAPDAPPAVNGLGTVHHVAFAIADPERQLAIRETLVGLGVQVTPVRDRQYFRSIYFRDPGGVLYEIATVQPGFTVDEALPSLGQDLRLPPWEEPHRVEIEAILPRVAR